MSKDFAAEMQARINDVRAMLEWNEVVSLSREALKPLLELAEKGLDQYEDADRRAAGASRRSTSTSPWEQPAIIRLAPAPAIAACNDDLPLLISELDAAIFELGLDENSTDPIAYGEFSDAAVDDEQEPELDPSLCNADITDRGDEHRMHFCTKRADHRDSHEDSRSGMGWTDGQHYDRFDDEDDDDPNRG